MKETDGDFRRAYPPEQPRSGAAIWLAFRGGELLVQGEERRVALPWGDEALRDVLEPGKGSPGALPPLYIGTLGGVPCLACELDAATVVPAGWRPLGLRSLFGRLDDPAYGLAGYAAQLLHWQRTSLYCPACGQRTGAMSGDWGRCCAGCGHTRYPAVSPAILALVHDGDRVLLVHKPGWGKRHSIVAGYVEPGEALETCVHREVQEEVGVAVADLVYAGSQPWPFPSQLMIGYMACFAGGELRLDDRELDGAAWFGVDALPELPPPLSLSRQLIDAWAASRLA